MGEALAEQIGLPLASALVLMCQLMSSLKNVTQEEAEPVGHFFISIALHHYLPKQGCLSLSALKPAAQIPQEESNQEAVYHPYTKQ